MNLFKKIMMIAAATALVGGTTVLALSASQTTVITEENSDYALYVPDDPQTTEEEIKAQSKQEDEKKQTSSPPEKKKEEKGISFEFDSLSLGLGESYELKTSIKAVKWESDNEKVAKVKGGRVKAQQKGSVTITAYDEAGKSAKCKITVKNAPDSVAFDRYDLTLGAGETYKLNAVIPDGSAAAGRSFSSSDKEVLGVTKSGWQGEFKALKPGISYAIVKLYNGREASCQITVKEAPDKVTISRSELTLGAGERYKLSAGVPEGMGSAERVYRSSDENIIKMTKTDWTGEFKAVKEGTAWVTVRTYNGKESSCKITVKKAPESVTLSKNSIEMSVGQHYTLTCSVNDGAASSLRTFRSSDSSILKMTKTQWAGAFTAVGEGTAWVTVRTYNGIETSCKVVVKPASQNGNNNNSYNNNGSDNGTWNGNNSGNYNDDGSSSNGSGGTNNNTGGGHTTAPDGTPWSSPSDDTVVYVGNNVITLTNNVAVLDPDDQYSISVGSGGAVSYSSGNTSIATVNDNGIVTAVSSGNTNIYIKDSSGNTAKLEVIVLGDRSSCAYPDMYSVAEALDSAPLNPMKTNYQPIDDMVSGIFSRIFTDGMSNSDKVQACYDYLAQTCTYGYDGYKAVSIDGYHNDEDKEVAEFSYCILKDQLGTCENFSAAFVVMMRRLGYEANQVYGQVAMSAGGYDGHYWADVEINGRHYLFDPQVERNCLGEDKYVNHYFYGMDPAYNYNMYRYEYMTCVHGFARY